jgi:hypothetical protein
MALELQKFHNDLTLAEQSRESFNPKALKCLDFYANRQWDQRDINKLKDEKRPFLTFNRILPIINSVTGTEMSNRFVANFEPRTAGALSDTDSIVTEMWDEVYRWTREFADTPYEESDAFETCVITGLGVTEKVFRYDEDGVGYEDTISVNPLEIVPDPYARRPGLKDAKWLIRAKWITEKSFISQFGKEVADRVKASGGKVSPVGAAISHLGRLVSSFSGTNQDYRPDDIAFKKRRPVSWDSVNDRFLVYEYQEKTTVVKFRVKTERGIELVREEDLQEFKERLFNAGQVILAADKIRTPLYVRSIISGTEILEDQEPIDVNSFTYNFMTGLKDRQPDGTVEFFGLVLAMIDPQQFSNKVLSEITNHISNNPKGAIIVERDKFENPDQIETEWNSPSGVIDTIPGALTSTRARPWEVIQPARIPQGIGDVLSFATSSIPDTSGVNQDFFVGSVNNLSRTANSAISSIQAQTLIVLGKFFDSLRLYRKMDAKLFLRNARTKMDPDQILRIVRRLDNQEEITPELVQLMRDTSVINYDVVITESPFSATKQAEFQDKMVVTGLLQNLIDNGIVGPNSAPEFLKLFGITSDIEKAVIKDLELRAQQQAAAQQAEAEGQLQGATAQ